jgi:hypothetical protein
MQVEPVPGEIKPVEENAGEGQQGLTRRNGNSEAGPKGK